MASYVIEVAVYTIWCRLIEGLVHSNFFVVVDSIKANLIFQPLNLFIWAGKSNDSAACVKNSTINVKL